MWVIKEITIGNRKIYRREFRLSAETKKRLWEVACFFVAGAIIVIAYLEHWGLI